MCGTMARALVSNRACPCWQGWEVCEVRVGSTQAGLGLDCVGYGTKIKPLGETTPVTVTVPTAPVFRLIVPRELGG